MFIAPSLTLACSILVMSKRPSKNYLYRLLRRHLPSTEGLRVLDAASSCFKNRGFFPAALYVGADLDLEALRSGVALDVSGIDYGYCCDLSRDSLPKACFDLAVSTHTFGHLTPEGRQHFVNQLIEALRPGGEFMFNSHPVPAAEWNALMLLVRQSFENVRVFRYRNLFSQIYEDHFMPRRYLTVGHPLGALHRFCCKLLEAAERVLAALPMAQESYFVVALGCQRSPQSLAFNPASYPQRDRILFPPGTAL